MNTTELSIALTEIFAALKKPYEQIAKALEGDTRKVLTGFSREAGLGSHGYRIGKAFDDNPDFVRDLALIVAASYSGAG